MNDKHMSIFKHLDDLRNVLIFSLVSWLIVTLIIYFGFRDQVLDILVFPLNKMDIQLVIITPFEGFMAKLNVCVFSGLLLSLPIILWKIWKYILPALRVHQKKYLAIIAPSSYILFLLGIIFACYYILDTSLKFLIITAGEGFVPMIGARKYIAFIISLLLPFGLVFQLPLVTILLTWIGFITPNTMAKNRKYIIVIIFIIAAIFTPPDLFSQILMVIPMIILYEISILISRLIILRR